MKLSTLKTKAFSETTPANLDAAIATFVQSLASLSPSQAEAELVSVHYNGITDATNGAHYTALLVYTS